ncbi:MAG: DUF2278 domain-containing protein, partial [Bacteroidota bacterium]
LLINPSPKDIIMDNWKIRDKNNNEFTIPNRMLKASNTMWITLPENTAQLSNKGGLISVLNNIGTIVHKVLYTQEQAKKQGETILF